LIATIVDYNEPTLIFAKMQQSTYTAVTIHSELAIPCNWMWLSMFLYSCTSWIQLLTSMLSAVHPLSRPSLTSNRYQCNHL